MEFVSSQAVMTVGVALYFADPQALYWACERSRIAQASLMRAVKTLDLLKWFRLCIYFQGKHNQMGSSLI